MHDEGCSTEFDDGMLVDGVAIGHQREIPRRYRNDPVNVRQPRRENQTGCDVFRLQIKVIRKDLLSCR
jgi:hypothetical protein